MEKTQILILNDDVIITDLLTDHLSDRFMILIAASGYIALKIIQKSQADLILVDYNMPEMSGIEFINRAREIVPDTACIVIKEKSDINTDITAPILI